MWSQRHRTGGLMGRTTLALLIALTVGSCSNGPSPTPLVTATPTTTASPPAETGTPPAATSPTGTSGPAAAGPVEPGGVTVVATDLTSPWGLAFLPDGTALVSERDTGKIKQVGPGGRVTTLGIVPGVDPGGEGGLLGIAVASDFTTAPWLYAYFTSSSDNRIVRMQLTGGRLGAPQVLVDGIQKAGNHNGGRLVFGPDGLLYAATGDAGSGNRSQDRESLNGKILRMRPDGSVPPGNPFGNSLAWSLGHRNVQGLAFDRSGQLWATEFGQNTWDELNRIQAGGNYGWPVVEGRADNARFINPVLQWRPDEASPSGLAYVRDTLFMASLGGRRLWVIPIPDGEAGRPKDFFVRRYGRLRTVVPAPDGSLWLVTSNTDGRANPGRDDDRILRLTLK